MIETIQDLVRVLLRDSGIISLDPAANGTNRQLPGVSTGNVEDCVIATNAAFQEIYSKAPGAFNTTVKTKALRAPEAVVFTTTQYSETISAFGTFDARMIGCTVRVYGEDQDNTIISATELVRPIMGASGSKVATVYYDTILLPGNIGHVIEPIQIPGLGQLTACTSREEFNARAYGGSYHYANGQPNNAGLQIPAMATKSIGQPLWVFVDTRRDATTAGLPIFLRLAPMPDVPLMLEYTAKQKPPSYTATDVLSGTADDYSDPGTIIPLDWVESILLPIARQMNMASRNFSNEVGKKQIAMQYATAISKLEQNGAPGIVKRTGNYPKPAGGGY